MLQVLEDELNPRLDKVTGTFWSEFMHVEHFTPEGAEHSQLLAKPLREYTFFSNNVELYKGTESF